ncbi:MAG TPA: asparagine synthase-related protein [Gemmatimonadales bacterium]
MTIIAGIWSATRAELPRELTAHLARALSRNPADRPWTHEVPGCFLAKVDIGAFGEPAATSDPDGSATVLAGEPLLGGDDGSRWRPRTADTRRLHDGAVRGDSRAARDAKGAYCALHYDAREHVLRGTTDLLGIRPLYEYATGEYVFFASALRILEGVPEVSLTLDARGALEQALLFTPLHGRSVYREVRLLAPSERVTWSARGRQAETLRAWDRVPPGRFAGVEDAVDAVDRAFARAVDRRRRDDTATVAFLSGGLDSRLIVTSLRRAGLAVRTLNFSLVGSLDHEIGRLFAGAIGSVHDERPYHAGLDDKYLRMAAEALLSPPAGAVAPERPGFLWAGYGGSGILGQINNHPEYVERCRRGDLTGAVDAFLDLKGARVPARLFRAPWSAALADLTRDEILAAVSELAPADPGRVFDLYLLLNATRTQLHGDHESTDIDRFEQQTPFFDPDLVENALSVPYEWLAGHHLYHRWLERFGPPVTSVPWQAYPRHEPCPLPPPSRGRPQWAIARSRAFRRKALMRAALRLLGGPLPGELLDRKYLAAVSVLHALGVRNYGYAIRVARHLAGIWERTGRNELGPASPPVGAERDMVFS